MKIGSMFASLGLDAKGFLVGMNNVKGMVGSATNKVKMSVPTISKYSVALAAVGAAAFITTKKLANVIIEVEAIERRLKAATGSVEAADKAWVFLRQTSEDLGIGLQGLASNYGSLAAAAQGTSLRTEDLESIFVALAEKAAILGMSSQRVRLAFLAIEQMTSKGVISMEELRRQFGENVPGAMGIMARSLGISVQELNKWVTSGRLLSDHVLPLMANQMRQENEPALAELSDSMQSGVAKMETAWFDLKKEFSDSVIADAVAGMVSEFTKLIKAAAIAVAITSKMFSGIKAFADWISKDLDDTLGLVALDTSKLLASIDEVKAIIKKPLMTDQEVTERQEAIKKFILGGDPEELAREIKEAWEESVVGALGGVLSDFTSLVSGLATGADVSFSKMINSMSAKILEFSTTMLVVRPILEWFDSWLKGVTGGVSPGGFASSLLGAFGLKKFARGGIITEPVIGVGTKSGGGYLLGEAGPEAVTPIGGGEKASRGAPINITINAIDSKSFADTMRENPDAIIGPIVDAVARGDRGLSSAMRMAVS